MSLPVSISPTNVHIAQVCAQILVQATGFSVCGPGFWHANGAQVSSVAPAVPGEILVIYLVGLGATSPLIPDGTAPVSPLLLQYGVNVNLTYTGNPLPDLSSSGLSLTPHYAGVTPGSVGLYQVNVRIPASSPPGTPSCGGTSSTNNVNITLYATGTILGATYDGGALCLKI